MKSLFVTLMLLLTSLSYAQTCNTSETNICEFATVELSSQQLCFKECKKGVDKEKCKKCVKENLDSFILTEEMAALVMKPCSGVCKDDPKKKSCISCLQANPDKYSMDAKHFGEAAVQPCGTQCRDGLEKHDCAVCILKNPKTFKLWNSGNELADCNKSDDQKSISCPDGEYVKKGSVSDVAREVTPPKGSYEFYKKTQESSQSGKGQ